MNGGPAAYESAALPTELHRHAVGVTGELALGATDRSLKDATQDTTHPYRGVDYITPAIRRTNASALSAAHIVDDSRRRGEKIVCIDEIFP